MEKRERFRKIYKRKTKSRRALAERAGNSSYLYQNQPSANGRRGLSYPDMTLVTSLCEILHVSEHELLTASDDMHQREGVGAVPWISADIKRLYMGHVSFAILAVLIPCFIGNLVTEHRLSWFFIVVGGLAMVFSFLNVPVMTKTRRAEKCFWCFYGSLIYMLCVCRIVLGGDWLIMSLLGVSFGLLSVFLPIILCSWHFDWAILHHKGLICLAVDTVLAYLMVFFGCLFYMKGVTGVIIAQNLVGY